MSNVPIETKPWPGNEAGDVLTLEAMAKFIRDDGDRPEIKSFAGNVLRKAGFPRSARQRAQVLLDYVRKNVGYVEDQVLREWVQSARITLCVEGAPVCIPIEDCDGMAVALGALLRASGLDVKIQSIDYGPGIQKHVNLVFRDDSGQWLEVDPTTSRAIGSSSHGKKTLVDPLDPKIVPSSTPDGAFMGVGKAHEPELEVRRVGPYLQIGHGAGYVSTTSLQIAMAETNASMLATDQAVQNNAAAMDHTDVTVWNGKIVSWVRLYADLSTCVTSWTSVALAQCTDYWALLSGWGPAADLIKPYNDDIAYYQGLVHKANPAYVPPPPPKPPTQQPSIGDQVATAAKAVGVVLLVAVGAFALYEGVSLTAAYVRTRKLAGAGESENKRRRRRARRMRRLEKKITKQQRRIARLNK